jgi:hypothetical protein
MKSFLWAVGVLVAVTQVAVACSDKTTVPPPATTDGMNPGVSPGGSSPTAGGAGHDAGTSDAGQMVLPEGGACSPANCPTSCCTTLGGCVVQQTNSFCGVGGLACVQCQAGATCIAGSCE